MAQKLRCSLEYIQKDQLDFNRLKSWVSERPTLPHDRKAVITAKDIGTHVLFWSAANCRKYEISINRRWESAVICTWRCHWKRIRNGDLRGDGQKIPTHCFSKKNTTDLGGSVHTVLATSFASTEYFTRVCCSILSFDSLYLTFLSRFAPPLHQRFSDSSPKSAFVMPPKNMITHVQRTLSRFLPYANETLSDFPWAPGRRW